MSEHDTGEDGGSRNSVQTNEAASDPLGMLLHSDILASSSTKLRILAILSKRRMTAPEVSRSLDMDRTGIYRHLETLADQGFVERHESDRKWVYYSLTKKGKALTKLGSDESLVGIFVAALGLIAYLVLRWWMRWQTWREESQMFDAPEAIPAPAFPFVTVGVIVLVAIVLLGVNRWVPAPEIED